MKKKFVTVHPMRERKTKKGHKIHYDFKIQVGDDLPLLLKSQDGGRYMEVIHVPEDHNWDFFRLHPEQLDELIKALTKAKKLLKTQDEIDNFICWDCRKKKSRLEEVVRDVNDGMAIVICSKCNNKYPKED